VWNCSDRQANRAITSARASDRAVTRGNPAITGAATILDLLETAPLPPNAHRSTRGDVLHIAFAADLADPASVAAARAAQEPWITPLVDARIELGWNELGDCMLHPAKTVVLEPFTVYDEWNHIGYKALVILPGSTRTRGHGSPRSRAPAPCPMAPPSGPCAWSSPLASTR
jgi:hypothetical protein